MNSTIARFFSYVFNPLFLPTLLLGFFYFITPEIVNVGNLPIRSRWMLLGFLWLYTFLIPIAAVYYMFTQKWVKTLTLTNLKDRRLPYVITTFFYLALSFFISKKHFCFILLPLLFSALP